ncbi:hypothetical protein EKN56_10500 [Limnobaculum zhutongyuii]|uniref:Uncharacterized protein n=1 Tax=Limnobaculum zhutongyuii TaxID=2498113 RepID=A0A411WKW9_9GAMM|nr:hypothetical protein [Limnobaculum zhutongyuii]QBH96798.1 hypothetical protein EKN56_10500 [Limnobaculum zhutongyuii]TQS90171.1 hypothetical protein ELQ32_02090 [Limnobaculum zhutongyuii]
MINFLRAYGRQLFIVLGLLGFGFSMGVVITEARLKPQIATAEKALVAASLNFSEAQRTNTEQHNDALKAAVSRQQAYHNLSEQLQAKNQQQARELEQLKQQRERSISHAVSRDGQAYTGLGPDGLRLYTAALGYSTATGNGHLSPYSGNADDVTHPTSRTGIGRPSNVTETRECLWSVGDDAGKPAHSDTPVGRRTEPGQ